MIEQAIFEYLEGLFLPEIGAGRVFLSNCRSPEGTAVVFDLRKQGKSPVETAELSLRVLEKSAGNALFLRQLAEDGLVGSILLDGWTAFGIREGAGLHYLPDIERYEGWLNLRILFTESEERSES